MIQFNSVTLSLSGKELFNGLSLSVSRGELIAVVGPNGAGKTSLLRMALGLLKPTGGAVIGPNRNAIGYLPQLRDVDSDVPLRGRDLVALSTRRNNKAAVTRALEMTGSTELAERKLGTLSGGEQQRIRIAQALVNEPELVLADEPFSGLDIRRQHEIASLIATQCKTRNTAALIVTHDINPLLDYVDRVVYLADGRHRFGKPEAVLTSETLSELYDYPVEVLRRGDRIFVLGADGEHH